MMGTTETTTKRDGTPRTITVLLSCLGLALAALAPALADDGAPEVPTWMEEKLADRVLFRLMESPSLDGSDLGVEVSGSTVILRGVVATDAAAERAVMTARRTRGVRQVADRLERLPATVQARQAPEATDEQLAKLVALELSQSVFPAAEARETWLFGWEVDGFSWELDVDVDAGIATLDGELPTHEDLVEAARSVYEIPGVRALRTRVVTDLEEGGSIGPLPSSPLRIGPGGYWPWESTPGPFSPYTPDPDRPREGFSGRPASDGP